MKPSERESLRRRLLERRRMLAGDGGHLADAVRHNASGTTSGDLSNAPYHMADVASEAYEEEFTFRMMESNDDEILAIDDALEKMREGTYGECEECGMRISNVRLHAIPQARLCIRCKRSEEERARRPAATGFIPLSQAGRSAGLVPGASVRMRA